MTEKTSEKSAEKAYSELPIELKELCKKPTEDKDREASKKWWKTNPYYESMQGCGDIERIARRDFEQGRQSIRIQANEAMLDVHCERANDVLKEREEWQGKVSVLKSNEVMDEIIALFAGWSTINGVYGHDTVLFEKIEDARKEVKDVIDRIFNSPKGEVKNNGKSN